jgi:hypothetical protein
MNQNANYKNTLTVSQIRQILSEGEVHEAKDKIERAEQTLEEVKKILGGMLFLHNGKLTTGKIDYAAFRIETLSLVFEIAMQTFRETAHNPDEAYRQFLTELGTEVGLTFGRDLIQRLTSKGLFLQTHDIRKLLELWASFENDTGAGETKIKRCDPEIVIIELKNNPLRRVESTPHAHCGFYKSYLCSLLNEIHTMRARILEDQIPDVVAQSYKIVGITENPDADGNCIFELKGRPELLKRAFGHLTKAYDQYFASDKGQDFSSCMNSARAALVSAQLEVIGLPPDQRPPRQLFNIFKGILRARDFKRMDEVYQRVSSGLHPEGGKKFERTDVWQALLDIRSVVYALELLELDEIKRGGLQKQSANYDRLATIEGFMKNMESFSPSERKQLNDLITKLKKGDPLNEESQSNLVVLLQKLGQRALETARPMLEEVLSEANKKLCGF